MKSKVKGFTLIELIVVIAIFGIIMFGALQLINPVSKMMIQSSVQEEGNAAVSSIANYLENELSTAEYLIVSNEVASDKGVALVNEFVASYYEGVLVNGSTPETPVYGTGNVHVMTIDNTQNGKISNYVYKVSFEVPQTVTTQDIKDGNHSYITSVVSETDNAINKAYYDSFNFSIKSGVYEDTSSFDPNDPVTYQDLISNISADNTCFTIQASTNRPRNNQTYSFLTTASMSLTNIYHRHGAGVSGVYYVIDQTWNNTENKVVNSISDITKSGPTVPLSSYQTIASGGAHDFTLSRHYGYVATGSKIFYEPAPTTNGYTFVYSYGSEICPENK